MCCQLTWWRALGITAQQRPASKKVRTERATPCCSSDMGHRDLQIQFNFFFYLAFSVDMKTKGPFQNPLCLCLRFLFWDSLYGTQHISENGPGRGKKKKKKLAAPNVLPPSTGRHTQLRKRQNIPIIPHLFWRQEVNLYGNIMSHDRSPRWQQWGEGT